MSTSDPPDPRASRGGLRSTLVRATRSRLVLIVAAAVLVLVGAAAAGRALVSSSPAPPPAPAPTASPAPPADPPGFVRFSSRDPEARFSIAYPKAWTRIRSADPQVKLLAAEGQAVSLLARAAPVGLDVTRETLPIVRDLTDQLVRADGRVQLRKEPQALVLDGLPGYRYDYTFDAGTGKTGAHVHYFLFKDAQVITLVFQALPAQRIDKLLPVFDQVVTTFRSEG